MKKLFLTKTRWLVTIIVLTILSVGNAWGAELTYTHAFSTKPSSGDNTLSTITWTTSNINNLNNYNSGYAGVQVGTSSKTGSITFTSKSSWGAQTGTSYYGYTNVKYVYVWLNNGSGTISATVTIGGKSATKSGTVSKNTSANDDYTKTSKLTFTPADNGKTGQIVIAVSTSSKAGYVAAIQVVCEEPAGSCSTLPAPGSPSSTAHATSVDLSWNSVAYSSGYLVTFDGTEYNIASGTTTKTITGLKKEKTYAWTVAAKGDGSTYCALGTATSEQSVTTLDGCTDNKVTYTVATTSSVTPSGAPAGTSASYSSTYGTLYQLTGGNSMTLTLTGYAGKKIKGLTLDMRSNGSAGAGTFSMVIGSTTVASISSATTFNEWYDNDSYGTDYRKVHVTLSDEVTVGTGESIVITIAATTNSLYCQGFALCYSSCTPLGSINGSINMSSSTDGTVTVKDWGEVSNASSYTVRMYKLTAPSTWTIVSGSAASGASGTQGTRTGITNRSTGVTYSGLEYGGTYKFTVQAIGNGSSYCDGEETAVTSINGNSLTDNKFLNKYSIYIDDATDANYAHNYITSISSHSGYVDITLEANKDYYQYLLSLGGVIWWSANAKMTSSNCSNWTLYTGQANVQLQTNLGGSYRFTLAAGTPAISVTYPPDDQASGKNIYFDNSILEWSNLFYRVGSGSTNVKEDFTLVAGTDNFYYTTTPEKNDISAWHIANNTGWTGSNDIYKTKTGDTYAITKSIAFQQYVVTGHMTIIPTTTSSKGSEDKNNNCDFYTINTPTSGMLTHTATITTPSHGTITISNTDQSLSATSTTANLPHRTILTITATPATGYTCTALTVNGAAFTSGSTHILAADATIAATFTANKYDVTLKPTSQTGSVTDQVVQATYDAAMPTTVKTAGTAIVIPERTGYSFTGWFDNSSGGKQYYQYTGSPKTLSSANAWDKTSATNLYAQWSINSYTLTWSWGGGSTSATSGDDYTAEGSVVYNTELRYPADNTMSRNGYTFNGWNSDATNMPAENLTITAQWTANQYVVTLDANGGVDGATTSVNTTFGQAMPTIAAANLPTRDGYRFDGFYTEKSSGTKYYNADGTSAKNQARYSDNQKLYAHWVAQLTFSVNGAIDGTLTRDVTENLPSSADVPTACGDCWEFAGWDASSTCSTTPGHAGGENAATHGITTPTTLHAVFGMAEYELIRATSDLEADAYYVLTTLDIDGYEYALKAVLSGNYGTSTDIASQIKEKNSWYYLYNPSSNLVWKFTGNSSSGRLYSESLSKYVDLTGSGSLYKDATSDYLSFSIPDPTYVEFNIASTTTTTQKLHIYNDTEWGPTSSATGIYIYKRQSATYATEPECETYDIVWKVNGTPTSAGGPTDETNTCTGIETLPTDPANNTLACANVFMGWSEEDLSGPDNEEPDDLFWRSGDAPKITGDKIFNAVFATGTPVANTYKLTSLSNIKDGQTVLIVNHTNNVAVSSTASGTKLSSVSVSPSEETITTSETSIKWTVTKSGDYYVFKSGDNYLRSGGSNYLYCDGTSDKWSISSGTVSGTYLMTSYNNSSYSLEYYNSNFTSYSGTGNAYNVEFYVQAMTYSDYMTNCCTAYTISGASKNGTDVIVSGNTGGTLTSNYNRACAEASVTLSATVNPGYAFGGWTITGATSGDLTSTLLPGDNATSLTPAAFEMPGENITVSATITEKTATAWTWTYKSGAIPNPLVMYVNEYHQLDVTYVPSDLLDGQKNYAVTKESSVAQVSKQLAYYKMRGAVGVTSATSSTVTFTLGGLRQDVNVTVKPLPIVTFVDIVHNKTDFANAGSGYTAATGVLTSTVSDGVVTHTQPTPTHSKLDVPGSGNDCELTHLVLIGWIRSDCPDVDNYMRGLGAKPGNAAITGAGNDGEGRAYFVSAGADIDVEDYNTLTFYAVWAKVE